MKAVWTWRLQVGQESPAQTRLLQFPQHLCDGRSIVIKPLRPPPTDPQVSCKLHHRLWNIVYTVYKSTIVWVWKKPRGKSNNATHKENKSLSESLVDKIEGREEGSKKEGKNSRVVQEWKLEAFHSSSSIRYASVRPSVHPSILPHNLPKPLSQWSQGWRWSLTLLTTLIVYQYL